MSNDYPLLDHTVNSCYLGLRSRSNRKDRTLKEVQPCPSSAVYKHSTPNEVIYCWSRGASRKSVLPHLTVRLPLSLFAQPSS
jgi:hypothetical protein